MFINFWYPAAISGELTDAPQQVRMLEQDFVLFRDDSGTARCLSSVCVHRGGSLAHGKIKGDCIECPYHGWQFNGEGHCTRVPSMGPEAKIPGRARVDAYPTKERYGLVFAFLGDLPEEERPPIMDIPDYDAEGWHVCAPVSYVWKSTVQRHVENVIDPAHVEYVHGHFGFQGADENYRVPELELEETDWGVGCTEKFWSPEHEEKFMRDVKGETGYMEVGGQSHGPASSRVWLRYDSNRPDRNHQYLFDVPIDAQSLRSFAVIVRNCMLDPDLDESIRSRSLDVAAQDQIVVERMWPPLGSLSAHREVFVPADDVIFRYRQFLKKWEDRGWRIDIDAVERQRGKVAFAIPSPARRKQGGWALDPVPLLPAGDRTAINAAE